MSEWKNFKKALRCEFKISNLLLTHEDPKIFAEPQIGGTWRVYVLYRIVLAVYTTSVLIYSLVDQGVGWLKFFTVWSYSMLTLSLILQACSVVHHYRNVNTSKAEPVSSTNKIMPVHTKVIWVIFNVSCGAAFLVTPLYWGLLYSPKKIGVITFRNANVHAVNLVIVVVDFFVTGIPIRLFHAWHGMAYGLTYSIFSVIWFKATHENIYGFLNWNNPGRTIAILMGMMFGFISMISFVSWLLYQLKICLYNKYIKTKCVSTQDSQNKNQLALIDKYNEMTQDGEVSRAKHDNSSEQSANSCKVHMDNDGSASVDNLIV